MRLVEPQVLVRVRMSRKRGTHLARAKLVIRQPREINRGSPAVRLDVRTRVGLKDRLPRQIDTVAVVPDVHHAFLGERPPDDGIDALRDAGGTSQRRLASLRRRHEAAEDEAHRPVPLIGILVVHRD